jgi:hypothetical protein
MPNGLENTDPPIQVGDGSILIKLNLDKAPPWDEWLKLAPEGHESEALSWRMPDDRSGIIKIEELNVLSGDNDRVRLNWPVEKREAGWSVLLVLRYSDGTVLQISPATAAGAGVLIQSSRPYGDFEESERELRFGGRSGPHVTEAYVCEPDKRRRTPLCRDMAVCRIGISLGNFAGKQPKSR